MWEKCGYTHVIVLLKLQQNNIKIKVNSPSDKRVSENCQVLMCGIYYQMTLFDLLVFLRLYMYLFVLVVYKNKYNYVFVKCISTF